MVVGPDRVLTNAHNLRDRTTQVTFADGRAVQGRVAGADPGHDLVVLDVWDVLDEAGDEVEVEGVRGTETRTLTVSFVAPEHPTDPPDLADPQPDDAEPDDPDGDAPAGSRHEA